MKPINTFGGDETGLELTEYVIAAALIALAVVLAFTNLGGSLEGALNTLANLIRTS
jgi:Flp pilus assembly pilin Flp